MRAFQIHPSDNIAVLLDDVLPGPITMLGTPAATPLMAQEAIKLGHKIATTAIAPGDPIIKHGVRIGHATAPIASGHWVHLHNCASDFDERSNTLDIESGAPSDIVYE